MDISVVYGIFAAILVASGVLLYFGTIGLKGDKKDDQLYKEDQEPPKWVADLLSAAFILSSDLELWYLVGFQRKNKKIIH